VVTIAHAHTAVEEEAIERALEADERASERAVCFLARAYAVPEADADAARRVLLERGLIAS
jgi:hypothetical protein